MNKLCLLLLSISILIGGCSSVYTVRVNGFSKYDEPLEEKASIYVEVDPNSQNPIFDDEIKDKIEILLRQRGYKTVSDVEHSDCKLAFRIGLDSRKISGYTPLYRPYTSFYDRYWGDYHFGYTSYVPYIDTYYDHWFVMKVFATVSSYASETEQVIWIGEAMVGTEVADLRRVINCLLIAGFEYFGKDTERQIILKIPPDDPRIIQISNLR